MNDVETSIKRDKKRDKVKLPGFRVTWHPSHLAQDAVYGALVPDSLMHARSGRQIIGSWTKWVLLSPGPQECEPESVEWWQNTWFRHLNITGDGQGEGNAASVEGRSKSIARALLKPSRDYEDPRSPHIRFTHLLRSPQDLKPVLEFARTYGPLGHLKQMRVPERAYPERGFDMAESAMSWFLAIRRVAAIVLLAEIHKYADRYVPLDDRVINLASWLVACSSDLNAYGNHEPRDLTQWHESEFADPLRWLKHVREGRASPDRFISAARDAFSEIIRTQADPFYFRLRFETGQVEVEAWSLLGTIYASLYDELIQVSGNRVCQSCGKRFQGSSHAMVCGSTCRKRKEREKAKS